MKTHIKIIFSLFFLLIIQTANAQFIEDALRFAQPTNGVGARALGLGNAYTGVADDYTAVWWNPAGLGQVKRNEFSLGLSRFNYDDEAKYFSNSTKTSNNNLPINNVGFVYSFPTIRGSLVLGFGYNKTNNFTTGMNVSGFNTASSIISSKIPGGRPSNYNSSAYTNWLQGNIPYWLNLTDSFGVYTPVKKNVQQDAQITESGNLGNWAFSGATEIAPNLMVGVSLLINSGSYVYDRTFTESDSRNLYQVYRDDYNDLDYYKSIFDDHISGDYSGFGAILGLHYNFKDKARIGLTIKTPFTYNIKEEFYTRGSSQFDDPYYDKGPEKTSGETKYTVTTPPVISGGIAYSFLDFMAVADFEWIDYSKLEFSDADEDVVRENNNDIKNIFQSVVNLKFGLEYKLPFDNLKIRAGYAMYPSAYKGDPSDFNRTQISFGLGYLIEESMMIDVTYSIGSYKTITSMYDQYTKTDEKITTGTLMLNLGVRF